MIESLKLENFQSHEKSDLNFAPGVNVIVGQSDSGKSSIIRALRWVTWNEPLGEAFRSHWGGDTIVTAVTADGDEIKRIRTNSKNQYILNENQLEAFGNEPPEEISSVLRMNDINLQQQLDAPFLLSNTAGEVALHFNKVAHLDVIDFSRKKVESWLRSLQQQQANKESNLEELEDRLTEYDFVDGIDGRVAHLEKQEQQKTRLLKQSTQLQNLLNNIKVQNFKIEELQQQVEIEAKVDQVLTQFENRSQLQSQKTRLESLLHSLNETLVEIDELKGFIRLLPKVKRALKLFKEWQKTKQEERKLRRMVERLKGVDYGIEVKQDALQELESEFHAEMPETCPLCGQEVKE
jgi:exonuclease SbcC